MTTMIEMMLGIIFIGTEFMPWQGQYQLLASFLIIILWIIEVHATVQAEEKYIEVYIGSMISIFVIQLFRTVLSYFLNVPKIAKILLIFWNLIRSLTQAQIIYRLRRKLIMKEGYESL